MRLPVLWVGVNKSKTTRTRGVRADLGREATETKAVRGRISLMRCCYS